jgi:hypothetical protein
MPILIDQWFKGPSPTCESGKYEGAKIEVVRSTLGICMRLGLHNNQGGACMESGWERREQERGRGGHYLCSGHKCFFGFSQYFARHVGNSDGI